MPCERPCFPILLRYRERRIGDRLDASDRAIDPVKEITLRLSPNDHLEAGCYASLTSDRSLAWPFTPHSRLRLSTRGA